MKERDRQLGWIGVVAGIIGIIVLNVAPVEEMLPVNRMLFAWICTLMMGWLLVSLIGPWGNRP